MLVHVFFRSAFCFLLGFGLVVLLLARCPHFRVRLLVGDFSLVPGSFRRFSAGVILGEIIPQTCGSSSTLFISQLEVTLLVLGYVWGLCSLAHSAGFVFALSTFVFL